MTLDIRSLTLAAAIVSALVYAVCFGLYALVPEATAWFFSYTLHLDLMGLRRIITWGSFFAGLVFWTVAMGVIAALFGSLYNRLIEGERAAAVRRERARA